MHIEKAMRNVFLTLVLIRRIRITHLFTKFSLVYKSFIMAYNEILKSVTNKMIKSSRNLRKGKIKIR